MYAQAHAQKQLNIFEKMDLDYRDKATRLAYWLEAKERLKARKPLAYTDPDTGAKVRCKNLNELYEKLWGITATLGRQFGGAQNVAPSLEQVNKLNRAFPWLEAKVSEALNTKYEATEKTIKEESEKLTSLDETIRELAKSNAELARLNADLLRRLNEKNGKN